MNVMKAVNFANFSRAIAFAIAALGTALSVQGAAAGQEISLDQSILEASAISVDIPLPVERPTLTWLIRQKMKFTEEELVKRYMRGKTTVREIKSPVYGMGKGYIDSKGSHLKVFDYGFEYQISAGSINAGVAKFIPDPDSIKTETGGTVTATGLEGFEYATDVKGKWEYVFPPDEGKLIALKLLKEHIGEIPDQGKDFSYDANSIMEPDEDGLFHLTIIKEFRGVQLLDDYIQVSLDADKKLVGVSYFWDDKLKPGPGARDKDIVDAGYAVNQAKKWVIQQAGGRPPHLTLMGIRLGFINMRGDYVTVIPCWIMACSWQHTVGADLDAVTMPGMGKRSPTAKRFVHWLERYDTYVAIEGVTGLPTAI